MRLQATQPVAQGMLEFFQRTIDGELQRRRLMTHHDRLVIRKPGLDQTALFRLTTFTGTFIGKVHHNAGNAIAEMRE
jgi:hypothetical protein